MRTQWTSALLGAALILSSVSPSFAQNYSDVEEGSFYEDAIRSLSEKGFLDPTQTRFRPYDDAVRSEMVKLLVELKGGVRSQLPASSSFDDVPRSAWYFEYFEEAGDRGWVRGDKNCYGTHLCWARPQQTILRAEAAALVVRVFDLFRTGNAPRFSDVPSNQWYTEFIQTAADYCVLQRSSNNDLRARPLDRINRAEMITMLNRAYEKMEYDGDCEDETVVDRISSVELRSSRVLRVNFSTDVTESSAENRNNYTVTRSTTIDLNAAALIDANTVELSLGSDLRNGDEVRIAVRVTTRQGHELRDTYVFFVSGVSTPGSENVHIRRITTMSERRLRVEFNADLDQDEAEDARNYNISGDLEAEAVDVIDARLITDNIVDLELDEDIRERDYRLDVDLETEEGRAFRDSDIFRGFDNDQSGNGDLRVVAHTRGIDSTITPGSRRPVFGFELQASCDDDVTVEEIAIRHRGTGDVDGDNDEHPGLEGLRMVHNGNDASPRVSVDRFDDDTITLLRFNTPLRIEACEEESIMIHADFENGDNGDTEHRFSIEDESDIDADSDDVTGGFPVQSLLIQVER